MLSLQAFAQKERKYIRRGNNDFEDQVYNQSEINYRRAAEKSPNSYKAIYNLGDALYKQEKYKEAAEKFSSLVNRDLSDQKLTKAYHNLGNALLKAGQLKESVEAYKNALKLNPEDIQTKHNLTYALNKLKKKEQEKKQDQNNQDNQDQDNQDQDNQDNQDQDNQDNQDQQRENQNQQNQQQNQKQDQRESEQSKKDQISKEDARRLLQTLDNDEKELQKKLKKEKAESKSAKSAKNW
ncbi:MAG: tetratricopeptide repeat protein [Bacteroidota bacterium]